VIAAIGEDKTGIRLSPYSTFQGMRMNDPIPQFSYFVNALKDMGIAYLHVVESRVSGNADIESTDKVNFAIDIWGKEKPFLLAGGFRPDSARRAADEEYKDSNIAIVFGRYFISNPDLPFRLQKKIDFTPYNRDTFYKAKSEEGYTDYSFSQEFSASL